jgi:hypothetical protein
VTQPRPFTSIWPNAWQPPEGRLAPAPKSGSRRRWYSPRQTAHERRAAAWARTGATSIAQV